MEKQSVKDFLHEKESHEVRGAVFEAWKSFKGIFKEKVIERSLKRELESRGLKEKYRDISVNQRTHQRGSASTIKGFTLLEILVAVSIFTSVILISTSLFSQVLSAQRKAFATRELIDNTRFSLETISKAIRMSEIQPPNGESNTIILDHPAKGTPPTQKTIIYELSAGQITEKIGLDPAIALTSSKIVIEQLLFRIEGVGEESPFGTGVQPRVTIVLEARDIKGLSRINLQTTVSQRELDI